MLQTAQIIREEQFLNIVANAQGNAPDNIAENSEDDVSHNALFRKVTHFYYNTRIRLSFSVSETYKSQYVLIRGMIEFHRPKHFVFSYNKEQRLIEIDINVNELGELELFLSKVLVWLKKENQFRFALKIALEFETRYKLENERVYELMKNTIS